MGVYVIWEFEVQLLIYPGPWTWIVPSFPFADPKSVDPAEMKWKILEESWQSGFKLKMKDLCFFSVSSFLMFCELSCIFLKMSKSWDLRLIYNLHTLGLSNLANFSLSSKDWCSILISLSLSFVWDLTSSINCRRNSSESCVFNQLSLSCHEKNSFFSKSPFVSIFFKLSFSNLSSLKKIKE